MLISSIFNKSQVRTFTSSERSTPSGGPMVIQIVITRDLPIQAILKGFYMTTVVNAITWNKAYAIFPLTTFVRRKGYMLKPPNDFYATLRVRYAERGWPSQSIQWPTEAMSNNPIRFIRRVGDQYTWIIDLDTNGIKQSKTPDSVIEYADFRLSMDRDYSCYEVTAKPFHSHALQYSYTYGDPHWVNFLVKMARNLIIAEVMKTESGSPNFEEDIRTMASLYHDPLRWRLANFQKPDTWTFGDERIPRWYEAWKEHQGEGMDGLAGVVTRPKPSITLNVRKANLVKLRIFESG